MEPLLASWVLAIPIKLKENTLMISIHMTVALIGSALLMTAAVAQTPNTMTMNAPAATTSVSGYHGTWRSSKLVGLNVYNDTNDKLGSISDLLLDKNGAVKAAVIGVGGFLGVGERLVAVPFEKLKFVDTPAQASASEAAQVRGPPRLATSAPATVNTTKADKSSWYPDHAVFSATKQQLEAMPEFKYST